MTDISHQRIRAAPALPEAKRWPLLPYLLVVAAGAAGLGIGRAMGGNTGAIESNLLLLLRFMAAMKFLGVLAAAGATHWRLSHSISRGLAIGYLGALVPMALAAGLIWSLGGIGIGAVFFHAGLLAFLCLAWKDDGIRLPSRR